VIQGQPCHKLRPSLKTSISKGTGRVAQVVEHLPSKREALSSSSKKKEITTSTSVSNAYGKRGLQVLKITIFSF
jgi:hypothetical protein